MNFYVKKAPRYTFFCINVKLLECMTEKQRIKYDLFCIKYLEHKNGAKAVVEAGYSPKSAKVAAARLLSIPYIIEKINSEKQKIIEKARYNLEDIQKKREEIAFHDITDIYNDDWADLKKPNQLKPSTISSISSVSLTPNQFGNSVTIKTANRLEALRDLERMYTGANEKQDNVIKIEINNHGANLEEGDL